MYDVSKAHTVPHNTIPNMKKISIKDENNFTV